MDLQYYSKKEVICEACRLAGFVLIGLMFFAIIAMAVMP